MRKWKINDQTQELCYECKKIVTTTFRIKPVKFNKIWVPNVLQSFCSECFKVVSIPHSSIKYMLYFTDNMNVKETSNVSNSI